MTEPRRTDSKEETQQPPKARKREETRRQGDIDKDDARIDEASDESFPASDPTAFPSVHAGEPQR
jgi:hypothetical protein